MQRPSVRSGAPGGDGPPSDPAFAKRCPQLWAHLTDRQWDDGSEREGSTFLVLAEGPVVKIWLNDRAMGRSLWVAGPSLQGALDAVEAALNDPQAGWRVNTSAGPRKGGKKS